MFGIEGGGSDWLSASYWFCAVSCETQEGDDLKIFLKMLVINEDANTSIFFLEMLVFFNVWHYWLNSDGLGT